MESERLVVAVLRECASELEDDLQPANGLVMYLYSTSCINAKEVELINKHGARFEQVRQLMDILRGKSSDILDRILEYLHKDGTQMHLVELLNGAITRFHQNEKSVGNTTNQILDEKWWPEPKRLINSYLQRKNVDGELLISEISHKLHGNDDDDKSTDPSLAGHGHIMSKALSIIGMGGVGKSSIVKWYANEYQANYDQIIWIDSEGASLETSFKSLAKALQIRTKDQDGDMKSLRELVKEVLHKLRGAVCLFIFDNVETYGEIYKYVHTMNSGHHLLITSRTQSGWGNENEYGRIPTFPLGVFTEDECLQLFATAFYGREQPTDEQVLKLGHQLGFLPLALQCAISTIIGPASPFTFSTYLQQIQRDKKMLTEDKILNEYERSISATLRLTLEQIESDGSKSASHRALSLTIVSVASYFPPEYVPSTLFMSLPNVTEPGVHRAMDDLVKYSLLSSNGISRGQNSRTPRIFTMHHLVQQVLRDTYASDSSREREALSLMFTCLQSGYLDEDGDEYRHFSEIARKAWKLVATKHDKILTEFPQFCSEVLPYLSNAEIEFSLSALARLYTDMETPIVHLRVELVYLNVMSGSQTNYETLVQLGKDLEAHLLQGGSAGAGTQAVLLHVKAAEYYFDYLRHSAGGPTCPHTRRELFTKYIELICHDHDTTVYVNRNSGSILLAIDRNMRLVELPFAFSARHSDFYDPLLIFMMQRRDHGFGSQHGKRKREGART